MESIDVKDMQLSKQYYTTKDPINSACFEYVKDIIMNGKNIIIMKHISGIHYFNSYRETKGVIGLYGFFKDWCNVWYEK